VDARRRTEKAVKTQPFVTRALRFGPLRDAEAGDSPLRRLFRLRAAALSDVELLDVVFQGHGRLVEAEEILSEAGTLRALCTEDPAVLTAKSGVGRRRAAALLAAVELGRRVREEPEKRTTLTTSESAFRFLAPRLQGLRREEFHVLCLNTRNVLLRASKVAEGSDTSCPVDPREIFSVALSSRAAAVIFAHNHPSGDPQPSSDDLSLTAQLVEAGKLLGVTVLDHLVVGAPGYVSFLERGLLPRAPGVTGR
jgi:DNA repair protein RadC